MSGYTPGPWTQDDTHGRRFIEQVGTGETVAIACKVEGVNGWLRMNANASLIAAAPDLLAALESITGAAKAGMPAAYMRSVIREAEIAIAKARGDL